MKKFNYDLIKADYEADELNDEELVFQIKTALKNLTPVERKIFLTYTEVGSYAATAREFNVSAPTAKTYVQAVKDKILKLMNYDTEFDDN